MGMIINPFRFAVAGGVWTTVGGPEALTGNQNNWNNTTFRQTLHATDLVNATGTELRFTIEAGSTENLTITKARIGLEGGASTSGEFAATPINVTWDGGSASTTITAGNQKTCDPITFAYDGTANIVIAFYTNGGSSADMYRFVNTSVFGNGQSRWKTGDDVDTVGTLSGYSNIAMSVFALVEALV